MSERLRRILLDIAAWLTHERPYDYPNRTTDDIRRVIW